MVAERVDARPCFASGKPTLASRQSCMGSPERAWDEAYARRRLHIFLPVAGAVGALEGNGSHRERCSEAGDDSDRVAERDAGAVSGLQAAESDLRPHDRADLAG